MYTCGWFVLCETVVHDSGTNNLSMVNALAEIRAVQFPSLFTKFAFAAVLHLQGEPDGNLSLRLIRVCAKGEEVVVSVPAKGSPQRAQFYFNFPAGIRLLEEGEIRFRLEAREGKGKWYGVGEQAIQVTKVEG